MTLIWSMVMVMDRQNDRTEHGKKHLKQEKNIDNK